MIAPLVAMRIWPDPVNETTMFCVVETFYGARALDEKEKQRQDTSCLKCLANQ